MTYSVVERYWGGGGGGGGQGGLGMYYYKGVGKGGAWGAKAPPEFLNRISYYLVLYMMNSFCNCKGMVSFVVVHM